MDAEVEVEPVESWESDCDRVPNDRVALRVRDRPRVAVSGIVRVHVRLIDRWKDDV